MRTRAALTAILLLVVGALCAPTPAFAHAVLKGTEPATGAATKSPPKYIAFRFSEPVEASFGAIRIYNTKGERVESGDAFHPRGESSALAGRLRPGLPKGTYTATYRVISADSHPVSGGLVFSIGKPSAAAGLTVSELLGQRGSAGDVTQVAFGVARGVQYASIAVAIGAAFFVLAVWLPALGLVAGGTSDWRQSSERFSRRLRRILLVGVAAGILSSAAGIVLQGATAAGISFWSALDPDIWNEVLETRFGTVWGIRLLVWAGLGLVSVVALDRVYRPVLQPASLGAAGLSVPRARPAAIALLSLPLGFLAISPALAGHASLEDPTWLMIPANVGHVVGMSVWVAGLVLLVLALPAATRALQVSDRTRLLAATVGRFSTVAGIAVAAILLTGITQSIVEVRSFGNLLDTAFGRAVLIKIGLFVVIVGLGAYNRRRSVPALRRIAQEGGSAGRTGLLLRRTLRAEVALVAVVLGVTSALVSYAPSIAVSSGGPVSVTRSLGPADLQLTVDPARVGPNQMHVYLIDKKTGAQFDQIKEFKAELALPDKKIGPLDQSTRKAGPGHYVLDGAVFGAAGDWKLKVQARVSEFDAYYASIDVPIK